MAKSSVSARKDKPKKPYPDFPLFPHATRRWAKKVRGKLVYFGPWGDPDAALLKWLDEKDNLLAGRTPSRNRDGLTLRVLCNRFLTAKQHLVDSVELTQRSFRDYYQTSERLLGFVGHNQQVNDLRPDDFEQFRAHLAKTRGPVALGTEIGRCRVLFNYAYQADLIDRPVK